MIQYVTIGLALIKDHDPVNVFPHLCLSCLILADLLPPAQLWLRLWVQGLTLVPRPLSGSCNPAHRGLAAAHKDIRMRQGPCIRHRWTKRSPRPRGVVFGMIQSVPAQLSNLLEIVLRISIGCYDDRQMRGLSCLDRRYSSPLNSFFVH